MNIGTAIKKAILGALTFAVAFITPQMVLKIVPDSIENLTAGAIIAALVVGATNAIKNWAK